MEDKFEDNNLETKMLDHLYDDSDEEMPLNTMQKDVRFFLGISAMFSLFYLFCLYENPMGITFPLYIAGCIALYFIFIRRLHLTFKMDSCFYLICAFLLAVSTCITDNNWILVCNAIGIWLLFGITMLHNAYDDNLWRISKYSASLIALFFGIIGNLFTPFTHYARYKKEHESPTEKSSLKYICIGLLITIPLLFIILLLLSSADLIFGNMIENLFHSIAISGKSIKMLFIFFIILLLTYSCLYTNYHKTFDETQADKKEGEPLIGITFTSIIAAVYLLFCAIQVLYIFSGGRLLPSGYTYASYARQGFFQLLFVCIINLVMVMLCLSLFRENKILKMILTIISACTYIMTASSAYRMLLYIHAYHLTRLRFIVLAALLAIAFLLFGVIKSIYKNDFPLFKYCTAVISVIYVLLSLSRMDAVIAEYNIKQEGLDQIQYKNYITTLSADAADIILKEAKDCPEIPNWVESQLNYYFNKISKYPDMNLRTFNLSRYRGKKAAADAGNDFNPYREKTVP